MKRILFIILSQIISIIVFGQTKNEQTLRSEIQDAMERRKTMVDEYQKNGNQFKDIKAFFINEERIVDLAEAILTHPNKSKEDEIFFNIAEACTPNLHVGAAQYVYDDPAFARRLLEKYYHFFESPIFSNRTLKVDPNSYILLPSLINWNNELDKIIRYADIFIKQVKNEGITEESKEAGWYPFYDKAVGLFNTEKYDQAYDAFVYGDEVFPGHIELVMGAGQSALKHAYTLFNDTSLSHLWFNKALKYLHKAEKEWPTESGQWAYLLYSCYSNLDNKEMAQKYKKYIE